MGVSTWPTDIQLQCLGLLSRVFVVGLGLGSSYFAGTFDSSPKLVHFGHEDTWLQDLWTHWDSEYFAIIAEKGYVYEQYFAFFPMLPFCMRYLRLVVSFLTGLEVPIGFYGWLIANACFIRSIPILHKLTFKLFGDRNMATKTCLLLCVSPATVFFSQAYTESVYLYFSLCGMLSIETANGYSGNKRLRYMFFAALYFAGACATRSNGVLLVLYLILSSKPNAFELLLSRTTGWFSQLIVLGFLCVLTIIPTIAYLGYGWYVFCNLNPARPWCNATVPSIYTFVQGEYWDVGLFNYYTIKQIPNFILAGPILVLSSMALISWVGGGQVWPKLRMLPYMLHLFLILIIGITTMHVQVSTRMIASSSPVIYWFVAHLVRKQGYVSNAVLGYFILYTLLGTVLFYGYYPWT